MRTVSFIYLVGGTKTKYCDSKRINNQHHRFPLTYSTKNNHSAMTTELDFASTMASLFAGSIGGAIGVGVSYPFDTLSTKAQVSTGKSQSSTATTFARVWKESGVRGFFEGVLVTMIGQALIKAIQFSVNEVSLLYMENHTAMKSMLMKMTVAGTLAGFLSSFVVSPIELLKIRMQAQDNSVLDKREDDAVSYQNEFDCAKQIVQEEGFRVLCFHGLLITIIREIPSFALYFVAYGLLTRSSLSHAMGPIAPLVNGALAGWAMWIPTYPLDIVKTKRQYQQNKKEKIGRTQPNLRQITAKIYQKGGGRAFFDGLEPKLARAAVKHAVTFWIYDIVMTLIRPGAR